ncbi:cytochrome p450 protein [Rutstroemia sp. NJR-2017a BVV2]|nr:cytochrome p450 protein [Rutstroemia sp. NJR-2017a BVV2]
MSTMLSLPLPVVFAGVALIAYTVYGAIWRLYFSPLAKFPGPKVAALTMLYEIYYEIVKGGQYTFKIGELHKKYGPIVRINPYELHINDPDYYDEIYAAGGKRRDKYAYSAHQFGNSASMVGTVGHDLHRIRRGAMNRYFSKASVQRLEPLIQSTVNVLVRRLLEYRGSGTPVDIMAAYTCFTNDVVAEYAFGRPYRFLEDSKDFHNEFHQALYDISKMAHVLKVFPWLLPIMQSLPTAVVKVLEPKLSGVVQFQSEMQVQIREIMTGENTAHETSKHPTIFHEVLSSDLPPQEKTIDRLWQEGQTVVGAGTETTAWTLSVLTCHLLSNPSMVARLKEEIKDKNGWKELEQLPYLTAVIHEGLRLSCGVTTHLQRICPDQVLKFNEWEIPAGTPVSMTSLIQHMDPRIFPDPYKFNPDRWLENPSLLKYLISFTKGSRQCLGINLAWAELYLCVKGVLGNVDMQLNDTTEADVTCTADYFTPKSSGRGVRVLVV